MYLVDNAVNQDPAVNLAFEEVLVRRFENASGMLLFYCNHPAVIIGRNQVPFVEAGLQAVQQRRAVVVRRISGGGAVYHGPGNLNFGWIQTGFEGAHPSPLAAVQPVLRGLQALGLPARLTSRHDILVEGRKVTGVAQYRTRKKCLTHGTLLVSADLEALEELLRPDCDVPFSRGRRSVRSQVTNLSRYRSGLTMAEVREALTRAFAASYGRAVPLSLEPEAWTEIRNLAAAKYGTWDWNVARSPVFSIRRATVLEGRRYEALIHIQRGIMTRIEVACPRGASPALARLAQILEGGRYQSRSVAARIRAAAARHRLPMPRPSLVEWLCPSYFDLY